jgi:hypothetical protein
MTERERKKEIRHYFEKLKRRGIRPEDIASKLKMSFASVIAWKNLHRNPRPVIILALEKMSGVKFPS